MEQNLPYLDYIKIFDELQFNGLKFNELCSKSTMLKYN